MSAGGAFSNGDLFVPNEAKRTRIMILPGPKPRASDIMEAAAYQSGQFATHSAATVLIAQKR